MRFMTGKGQETKLFKNGKLKDRDCWLLSKRSFHVWYGAGGNPASAQRRFHRVPSIGPIRRSQTYCQRRSSVLTSSNLFTLSEEILIAKYQHGYLKFLPFLQFLFVRGALSLLAAGCVVDSVCNSLNLVLSFKQVYLV